MKEGKRKEVLDGVNIEMKPVPPTSETGLRTHTHTHHSKQSDFGVSFNV